MKVFVLSKENKPLMPCEPVIARLLLKQGKAKVKRREPFTIKLLYETTNYTQELKLGVDIGSKKVGTSVVDQNGVVLYASEIQTRNQEVTKKMTQRKRIFNMKRLKSKNSRKDNTK